MMDLADARRVFAASPTARVATIDDRGAPHVVPLWFVWREDAIYLSLRVGSATWRNAERDPRISVVLDTGHDWAELSGVILEGVAELLPIEHRLMRGPASAWHEKYRSMLGGDGFERMAAAIPELGFLRLEPSRVQTWDHARGR